VNDEEASSKETIPVNRGTFELCIDSFNKAPNFKATMFVNSIIFGLLIIKQPIAVDRGVWIAFIGFAIVSTFLATVHDRNIQEKEDK